MTPETTKQIEQTLQKMYELGVDDGLNLVQAVIEMRITCGSGPLSNEKLLELIETSRENFKGK